MAESATTPTTVAENASSNTAELAGPECTTAVPGKFGHVPPGSCNANYGYDPSWEWNAVFAACFAVTTLVHIMQAWRFKKVRPGRNVWGKYIGSSRIFPGLTLQLADKIEVLLGRHYGRALARHLLRSPLRRGAQPAGDCVRHRLDVAILAGSDL